MRSLRHLRPSPALVVSCVALFVALSGTALALEANSVGSKQIRDDAVKRDEIGQDAVGYFEIQENSVGSRQLTNEVIGSYLLQEVHVEPGESTAIFDGDGGNADWSGDTAAASCRGAEQILSGYGEWTDASGGDDTAIAEQVLNPATDNVVIRGIQNTGATKHLRAVAVCLDD